MKFLTRKGFLIEEQAMSYLDDSDPDRALVRTAAIGPGGMEGKGGPLACPPIRRSTRSCCITSVTNAARSPEDGR